MRIALGRLFLFAILCAGRASAGDSVAQDVKPPADLTPLLEQIRSRHKVPALAAGYSYIGELSAIGATGVRAAGRDEEVTVDDKFHIGSCAKAMTAVRLAILVNEGKLRWDQTVAEIFPDLAGEFHADARKITVEQLLTHRAGLPEDRAPDALFVRLRMLTGPLAEQREKLLLWTLQEQPATPPGEKFAYSNRGYAIAGTIAAKVAGRPWEDLIRAPLAPDVPQDSIGFGAPGSEDALDQPRGHRKGPGGEYIPLEPGPFADNPLCTAPAGGIHLTLRDWLGFGNMCLLGALEARREGAGAGAESAGAEGAPERGVPRGRRSLFSSSSSTAETKDKSAVAGDPGKSRSMENVRKLFTPPPGGDYAMGWAVGSDRRLGHILEHAGSNALWFALIRIAPEKGVVFVAATNCADEAGQKAVFEAVDAMTTRFLDEHK